MESKKLATTDELVADVKDADDKKIITAFKRISSVLENLNGEQRKRVFSAINALFGEEL